MESLRAGVLSRVTDIDYVTRADSALSEARLVYATLINPAVSTTLYDSEWLSGAMQRSVNSPR